MDVFGALADPVRRSLLVDLASAPRRVVDLADARTISRPAVSKHLRLLREAGAVSVTERGRERYYALAPTGLEPVQQYVEGLLAAGLSVPVPPQAWDALETEVRRASRDRRRNVKPVDPARTTTEETA